MKIIRILIIIVALFIIAEVVCRVIMPSYVRIIDNHTKKRIWLSEVIESSQKGKRFKPNLDLTVYNVWISHRSKLTLRTNALGLRGGEIDAKNINNEYRILVLGDSITWAGYLSEEDTYVSLLQEFLKRYPRLNVRTINAGVGDIGISEEVELLKERFDTIKPKIVILAFYLNDSRPPLGFESEKSIAWARRLLEESRFIGFLYGNIRVQLYLMRHKIFGRGYRYRWFYLSKNPSWKSDRSYFKEMVQEADLDWGAAWDDSAWEIVKNQIEELNIFSKEKGIKLLIVCLPVSFQVYAEFLDDYPQKKLMDISKNKNIPYLNMLPILRKNKDAELFYDHCHLNEEGQRIVAQELAEYIIRNKLIL